MKEINIKDESNRMNYLRNYDLDSPEAVDMDLFIVDRYSNPRKESTT